MSFTQLAQRILYNAKKIDHYIDIYELPAYSFQQGSCRDHYLYKDLMLNIEF
jgi:hypothetical protein